jgi:hypothetical protein
LLLTPSSGALSHRRSSSAPRLLVNLTRPIRDSTTAPPLPPSWETVRRRSQLAPHCWSLLHLRRAPRGGPG